MNTFKKPFTLLLILLFLLAACNSGQSQQEETVPQATAVSEEMAEEMAEPTEEPMDEEMAEPTEEPMDEEMMEPTEEPMEDEAVEEMMSLNAVIVSDQTVGEDHSVVIDSVTADVDGYIVIHADADGAPGPVIGFSPVMAGENENVSVEIDGMAATETLYAMLHVDEGEIGEYEFPGPDGPAMDAEGNIVTPAFIAEMAEMMMDETITSLTGAADLRTALTNLLGEHVLLAASATNAAVDGRDADFEAAAAALDGNSVALADAITSIYGEDAGAAFLELWRTHIGFFVDYTVGAATGDAEMQEMARENLSGYGQDFAAFISGANPNIPAEAVEANLAEHVETLTAVIDAQAAGDPEAAFMDLRHAFGHMQMTALALASGISTQFPDQFAGDAATPAADLRITLNRLLAEHTYLAAMATDAALGGREAEFEAAAAALDTNTVDLGAAIGSVYGDDAEEAFISLWRTHIGFFVDYTLGVASDDQEMKDMAIDDLIGYRTDFIAFLNGANPNLTEEALSPILTPHVNTLTAVIDAQGAGTPDVAYTTLREAYAHMHMIADPLSEAIVQQFPENFQ